MPVAGTAVNTVIAQAQGLDAQVESANVKAEQDAQAAADAEAARTQAEQAAQAEADEKARLEAEAKVAKLKAKQEAKAEAARIKAEKKAKAQADAQAAAEARAAKLKARQEAKAEAARLKAEQKAQAKAEAEAKQAAEAEAAKVIAEQDAQAAAEAEAARAQAEQAAQAEAGAKQAAEAEAAKVKAEQDAQAAAEADTARAQAEQAAQAEADEKARLEAEVKAARIKAKEEAKAEAARTKAEKKAKAQADAQAAAEARAAKLKAKQEAKAEAARIKDEQKAEAAKVKAEQDAQAAAEAEAARVQAEQAAKATAEQDAQAAAEAEAARVKAEQAAQAEAARLKAEQDAQSVVAAARLKEEERTSLTVLRKIMSTQGVQLALDPTDANVIFHKDPMDNSSFPVWLIDGDKKLSGRLKTKGSFTRNFVKKSLVITFDGNTTWHGQHKVSFNAMATDVSQMRDYLANDLMKRLNMATPDMQFTKLYVNGSYIGEYLFVEWVEPKMFERFGLGADGELYSPDDAMYCGSFDPADMHRLEKCYFKLDKGQHDYSKLKKLAQDLNDIPADKFDEYYDKNFDGDSLINWLVVNTLTGNEDTYNKNFFLYFSNKTQKWTVVPWDYDLAFGRVGDPAAPYPFNRYNKSFQYLHPPESGATNPMKEKALKNDKLYKRYLAKIKELFADESMHSGGYRGWYHPENFRKVMTEREADNRESIKTEKYPNPDREDYSYVVDSVRFFNEWRYQYLAKLMLTPTVWDTPLWKPYASFDPLTPRTAEYYTKRHIVPLNLHASTDVSKTGKRVFFIDPLMATPLMAMDVKDANKPVKVLVEVESQQPPVDVPRGIQVGQCVERTWHINVRTPGGELETGLEMDFLDEGLTRHEMGAGIKRKANLALWMQVAGEWQPLASEINPRSNSFIVRDIVLNSGSHTLVACANDLHEAALKAKAKAAEEQFGRAEAEAARVQAGQAGQTQSEPVAAPAAVNAQQAAAEADEKARLEAEAKAARIKAKEDAKAEAARIKAEKKAKAQADAQAAAEAKAAKLMAKQEAKAEAARLKAEQKAQAEADAKAAAEAKAAADAEAAKLKAEQDAQTAAEAEAAKAKADQEAQAAAEAEAARVKEEQAAQAAQAEEKARLEAEVKAARIKAKEEAKAEAARIKAEKKAKAQADAQAAAEAKAAKLKAKQEAKAEAARIKAEQKAQAQAAAEAKQAAEAEAAKVKAEQAAQAAAEAEAARLQSEQVAP